MLYQGTVTDRLYTLLTQKTKIYKTYFDAHQAAERLAKKKMGERAYIEIDTFDESESGTEK